MECWVEGPNNTFLLTLHSMLHVPGIKCRFLSLSTFDDKCFLFMAKNRRFELKKGQAGITGCCVGKLYIAPMWQHKPPHSSAVHLNAAMVALPAKVWHEQMGHLDWDSLKAANTAELPVFKELKLMQEPLVHSSTCPGCQAGKLKCQNYKASTTCFKHSTHPLKWVHSDLVGPLSTASIHGHQFAVSFTCDSSDHTWCHPIKSKDQTL